MSTVALEDLPLARIYRWERERADKIFLTQPFGGGKVRTWTWFGAVAEARRIAAHLKAQNWESGSRVAILSKNCAWWFLADYAIWMAGHVSVPIYASLQATSVREILEHCQAKLCFVGATDEAEMAVHAIPSGIAGISFPTVTNAGWAAWDSLLKDVLPLAESPTRAPSDLATVIYTSGTTGAPKGVMHTFANLSYNAKMLVSQMGLTPEERVLSYLPLAHIVERVAVEFIFTFLGAQIFFTEGIDHFIADLRRAQPTIFLSVPRLLLKFQQNVFAKIPARRLDLLFRIPLVNAVIKRRILTELGLATVKRAACGAAPLPPDILLWYRRLGLDLAEGYGMTETLITHLPGPGEVRPGYVGSAIAGVEAKLSEDSELLIRSPMNMLGYYKDPQTTSDSFLPDGFFRTGDVCQIAPDGQLKIIGRTKEQFKTSKGKYVAPAPIESKLASHSAVEACCVMGAGQPSPFAVILISDDARKQCRDLAARQALENSFAALLEETNRHLNAHERLAFLALVDGPWTVGNGMMTPTLKLKRPLVERSYGRLVEGWRAENRPIVWESLPQVLRLDIH